MTKQILEHVYDKEASIGDNVYLTQPIGNGDVKDYTWKNVVGEARRMATHLQGLGFERGQESGTHGNKIQGRRAQVSMVRVSSLKGERRHSA